MLVTTLDVVITGLLLGGIYAVIAMGLSLQYGVARVLNVSHGEFIMVGAFITWMLYTVYGINPLVCLAIVGPITFVIGFIIHGTFFKHLLSGSPVLGEITILGTLIGVVLYQMVYPNTNPLIIIPLSIIVAFFLDFTLYKTLLKRRKTLAPSPAAFEGSSLLATFGLLFVIQNMAITGWGALPRGYTFLATPVDIGGAIFGTNRLVTLGFALAIGVVFYIFLVRTRLGKAIRAAAQDSTTAGLMGVNITPVLALCFGLGALMAGFAGVLFSMCFNITPTMGLEHTIIAIIVVVLGGLGSIPGSFIGGLLLGLIGSIVTYIEPALALVAYYFIFVILLLVRPKGIFGK